VTNARIPTWFVRLLTVGSVAMALLAVASIIVGLVAHQFGYRIEAITLAALGGTGAVYFARAARRFMRLRDQPPAP
jgi:hypothetical protein